MENIEITKNFVESLGFIYTKYIRMCIHFINDDSFNITIGNTLIEWKENGNFTYMNGI